MKYWNRRKKYQLIYMLVDFMSAMLVWMAFLLFRWLIYEGRMFSVDTVLIPMFNFYWPLVLYPLGCLFVYYLSGYYLRPLRRPYSRELRRTLVSSLIISVGAFFLIVIDDPINGHYDRYLTSLLVLFVLQFFGCYLPRLLVTYIAHTFDDRAPRRYTIRSKDEVIEFEKAHAQQAYDEVILDLKSKNKEEEMYMLISRLYPANVEISVVPSLYDMLTGAAVIADVADQPLIPITEHKMNDAGLCIKRAFDVVVSLMALILLSPIYILVAIAVWSTSSGPIFYLQERIGLHGIPFSIIKFRTMRLHAEKDMPQLSLHNDPRVTRVGM